RDFHETTGSAGHRRNASSVSNALLFLIQVSSIVHTQDGFSFVAELIVKVDSLAKLGQIKCPHLYFYSYHSGPGMSHIKARLPSCLHCIPLGNT
ncbi:hypothetical protein N303_03727, partial [Cuculus canorus]